MTTKPIQIRWTLDYGEHLFAQAEAAMREDREAIIAYGTITEETKKDGGVIVYITEYADSDGWDARGQVEETSVNIGNHADYERIT